MLNTLYTEDNTKKGIQNIPYFHCGPHISIVVLILLVFAIHHTRGQLLIYVNMTLKSRDYFTDR